MLENPSKSSKSLSTAHLLFKLFILLFKSWLLTYRNYEVPLRSSMYIACSSTSIKNA